MTDPRLTTAHELRLAEDPADARAAADDDLRERAANMLKQRAAAIDAWSLQAMAGTWTVSQTLDAIDALADAVEDLRPLARIAGRGSRFDDADLYAAGLDVPDPADTAAARAEADHETRREAARDMEG